MNCQASRSLIPSYLDGELSEAQAAPLRQHLMDCSACRRATQGQKGLGRWFQTEPASDLAVPPDFAARVTRLAFAGAAPSSDAPAPLEPRPMEERRLQPMVLWMTTAAAAALLVVSALLAQLPRGEGTQLRAGDGPTLEETLEELDRLSDPAGAVGGLEDLSDPAEKDEAR